GPRTGERNERTAAEAGSAGVDRDRGWSLVHGARPGGERQAAQGALLGHAGVPVAGDAVEPERRRRPEDRQPEGEERPRPQPRHLSERRLLRAARQIDRQGAPGLAGLGGGATR